MEPQPVSYAPAGAQTNVPGWSGPRPGIRRVLATIEFTDGHRETILTHAHQWTAEHVEISVVGQWGWGLTASHVRVWVPADRIEQPPRPPVPGEYAPHPESGPTAVVLVSPERCSNGHPLKGNAAPSFHPCVCPRGGRAHGGRGYHSWTCRICGDTISGPPPHTTLESTGVPPF